jgi:F-type H+-transporting ATPase subunit a
MNLLAANDLVLATEGATEGGEEGFHAPGLGLFSWRPLFEIGPFGFTKPMLLALIVVLLVVGFFWAAFRRPQLVPRGAQNLGEVLYGFVRDDIARSVIGKKGDRYVPLLVSLFFFIWLMNLMSIVPVAQFPVTSRIGYPAALAAIVYLTWVPLGIAHQGAVGFFKNMMFPPGLPWWIYPILAPIELVSNLLVRPFTHAVRLFANMFAGHLLIALFSIAAWYFLVQNLGPLFFVGILGFVMAVIMTGFELLIQALQAFIFTLLTAVYISGALEAEH